MNSDAWYAVPGKDNDVVLSSRVRFARNLANFPFPARLRASDSERIQAIVFDAFNHFEDSESYQAISVQQLDAVGKEILVERGVLDASRDGKYSGVVMRSDGKVSCTVNDVDHVRISSFSTGLDFDAALSAGRYVDASLQKSVQFAASYDFGYLTSSLFDAGSGMKLSVRLHLPSLSLLGKIGSAGESLSKKGFTFTATYGLGAKGSSLGSFYQVSSLNSLSGSEFDQVASLTAAIQQLTEQERLARKQCMESEQTQVRNQVYRSLALCKYSKLLELREAISLISGVQFGLDTKLLSGVDDSVVHALLYRMQDGHLEFVLKNGDFHFEEDIAQNMQQKKERLRALIVQEAFEAISVTGE